MAKFVYLFGIFVYLFVLIKYFIELVDRFARVFLQNDQHFPEKGLLPLKSVALINLSIK